MGRNLESLEGILARAVDGMDGFLCDREGEHHRLELWGRLPSDWAGNLCMHLFAADLQIVEGDAIRSPRGPWAASLLLASRDATADLGHDFLLMARHSPRGVPELPTPVVSISVQLSHDSPGSVYAHVVGKDSGGLMAQLLEHFRRFELRPSRFVIRTQGDEVDDWFWLDPISSPTSTVVSQGALERDWRHAATR